MEEYFTKEIKRIKQELTDLKTTSQKSAGVIPTTSQTVSVSIPLSLNAAGTSASGHVAYTVTPENGAIIVSTLDHYYDDITKVVDFPATTRSIVLMQNALNNDEYILYLYGRGDANDRSTLSGGGSVSLTAQLTVRSTANFIMEAL